MLSGPYAVPVLRTAAGVDLGSMLSAVPARLGSPESALRPVLGPLFRPFAAATTHLDVGASVGGRGPRVAYAALTLDASTTADRWLFLGTDDAVSVWLDGREVFRSASARASREDDDAVPLRLTQGAHTLVLKLAAQGDMDLFARVTNANFAPDPTLRFTLEGVDDAGCNDLARRATAIHAEREVTADGTRLDATVSFSGGTASVEGEATRTARIEAQGLAPVRTEITVGDGPVGDQTISMVVPRGANAAATVLVGTASAQVTVNVDPRAADVLLRARRVLAPLDPAFGALPTPLPIAPPTAHGAITPQVIWSVERAAERLADLLSDQDNDSAFIASETTDLAALLDAIEAGRDPYATLRGAIRRAYRSPLDGTLQEYSLYVPQGYRGDREFPLVMTLHGLHGSAHRMLPIMFGLYDESESRTHAERHLPTLPDAPAIVLAPYGHGDAGYRHQGEYDPMRTLDEVRAAYRIDAARTYMTGLSMGGIGAAALPLHHPDVFAAAAPLCGYHSYFVRGDTQGTRRPWEPFLMELRSNASWAENGLHLPMYIVQGTLDRPLTNSTVLADRYTELHYALETEWPTLGHNVWSQTYANGRIFPYFLRYRRDLAPRTIRFRTPDLRWRQSDWLTFDRIERRGRWAEAEVSVDPHGGARMRTQNLTALTLSPPATLVPNATELALSLDGDTLRVPLGRTTSLVREGGHWAVGARPSVLGHGPIREVQDTPLLFVYGASAPAEARLNARVAQSWAHRAGIRVRYPVVRDDSYTEAMGVGRTLVLVGSPASNRLLAQRMARLPLRVEQDAITVGTTRYQGNELGAVFATHDPDAPERTLVVITGSTALGAWRSRSLPDLLPDFVVYDRSVGPARGRVLLGARANVLAAGYLHDDGAVAR